jgi:hypothetical protein
VGEVKRWIKINILNYCERCLKHKATMRIRLYDIDSYMKKTCTKCFNRFYGQSSQLSNIMLEKFGEKHHESK